MSAVLVALALIVCGCTVEPPSPPRPPDTKREVVLLSGQSNAAFVAPYLTLPLESVIVVARPGQSIGAWQPGEPLWLEMERVLTAHRVTALVWWQGASDRRGDYLEDLRELVARVRQTAGQPGMLVVIVRVLDRPENRPVREAQQTFVSEDRRAVLVTTDGLGEPASDHLTPEGYAVAADRIRAALDRTDRPAMFIK